MKINKFTLFCLFGGFITTYFFLDLWQMKAMIIGAILSVVAFRFGEWAEGKSTQDTTDLPKTDKKYRECPCCGSRLLVYDPESARR
jgi:hypothetical protein